LDVIENVNAPVVNTNVSVPVETGLLEPLDLSSIPMETQLKRLARTFTERYGTFSNQNDLENLESLNVFMTDSFIAETDQLISRERANQTPEDPYYGITTRVISLDTVSFDEDGGFMTVELQTQRDETDTAAGTTQTIDQDALLKFNKVGDRWLVDSFQFTNG